MIWRWLALVLVTFSLVLGKVHRDEVIRACHLADSRTVAVEGIAVEFQADRWKLVRTRVFGRRGPEIILNEPGPLKSGGYYRAILRSRCLNRPRNPRIMASGLVHWELPVASASVSEWLSASPDWRTVPFVLAIRLREAVSRWLLQRAVKYPTTHAIVRATWMNDLTLVAEPIVNLFRDFGLMHVMALSATHVTVLLSIIRWFFWPWIYLTGRTPKLRRFIPCLALLAMALLSLLSPSMARVSAVGFFSGLLAFRGMHISLIRRMGFALLVVSFFDLSLLGSLGFWLSMFGATLLGAVHGRMVAKMILVPIGLAPLLLICFGRVSVISPLSGFLLGWLWEVIVMPVGFMAPFLPGCVVSVVEAFLVKSIPLALHIPTGFEKVWYRPTVFECGLSMGIFLLGVDYARGVMTRNEMLR